MAPANNLKPAQRPMKGRKTRPISSSTSHNHVSTAAASAKLLAVLDWPIHGPAPALMTASRSSTTPSSSPRLVTPPTPTTTLAEVVENDRRSGRLARKVEARRVRFAATELAPSLLALACSPAEATSALRMVTSSKDAVKKRKAVCEDEVEPAKRQRKSKKSETALVVKRKASVKTAARQVKVTQLSAPNTAPAPIPRATAKVQVPGAPAGSLPGPKLMKAYKGSGKVYLLYWRRVRQLGVYPSTEDCTWAFANIMARGLNKPEGPVRVVWWHDLMAGGFDDTQESFDEFKTLYERGDPAGVNIQKQLAMEPIRVKGQKDVAAVEEGKVNRACPDEFIGNDGGRYRWRHDTLQYAVHPSWVSGPGYRWTAVHSRAWLARRAKCTKEYFFNTSRYNARVEAAEERREMDWRVEIEWLRKEWRVDDQVASSKLGNRAAAAAEENEDEGSRLEGGALEPGAEEETDAEDVEMRDSEDEDTEDEKEVEDEFSAQEPFPARAASPPLTAFRFTHMADRPRLSLQRVSSVRST